MDEHKSQEEQGLQVIEGGKKGTKGRPREKEEKIPDPYLFEALANAINHNQTSLFKLPEFPHNFYVTSVNNGPLSFLAEKESGTKLVSSINDEYIVNSIIQYVWSWPMKSCPAYHWSHRKCLEAFKTWRGLARHIEVEPYSQLSEDKWCYHKIPFDFKRDLKKTPLFDEFLSRVKQNKEQLCCFLGSLFDKDSDRQQYVWLNGDGNDGKGSILRLLARIFGPAVGSEDNVLSDNRFWTAGLLNKRLVMFPDINSTSFIQSGLFKRITGNDPIRMEEKGKPAYTAMLNCKILIASNNLPRVSSQRSDTRRIIYCGIKETDIKIDAEYEDRLWEEAPYIIGNCIAMYKSMLDGRKRAMIEIEKNSLDELIAETEDKFIGILSKRFVVDRFGRVSGQDMRDVLGEEKIKDGYEYQDWIKFLRRNYNIEMKRCTIANYYHGIRLKTRSERDMASLRDTMDESRYEKLHNHIDYVNGNGHSPVSEKQEPEEKKWIGIDDL